MRRIMLKSLKLEGWKSFGKDRGRSTLELAPLTLLVGPNASGKSNALDALRFLQGAALDYPLGDVLRGRWEGQREVWPAIRGSVVEAAHVGRTSFKLSSTWSLDRHRLEHTIGVRTRGDVALNRERLAESEGYLFDTHASALGDSAGRAPGGGIKVALRRRGKGNSPTFMYSSLRSLLGQIEDKDTVSDVVLVACLAVQEVEVWLLALYKNKLGVNGFAEVRKHCDPKERWAIPLLDRLESQGPGRGRKRAVQALTRKWRSLRDTCSELRDLQKAILAWHQRSRAS